MATDAAEEKRALLSCIFGRFWLFGNGGKEEKMADNLTSPAVQTLQEQERCAEYAIALALRYEIQANIYRERAQAIREGDHVHVRLCGFAAYQNTLDIDRLWRLLQQVEHEWTLNTYRKGKMP